MEKSNSKVLSNNPALECQACKRWISFDRFTKEELKELSKGWVACRKRTNKVLGVPNKSLEVYYCEKCKSELQAKERPPTKEKKDFWEPLFYIKIPATKAQLKKWGYSEDVWPKIERVIAPIIRAQNLEKYPVKGIEDSSHNKILGRARVIRHRKNISDAEVRKLNNKISNAKPNKQIEIPEKFGHYSPIVRTLTEAEEIKESNPKKEKDNLRKELSVKMANILSINSCNKSEAYRRVAWILDKLDIEKTYIPKSGKSIGDLPYDDIPKHKFIGDRARKRCERNNKS